MWFKSAFYVTVAILCLSIIAKTHLFGMGDAGTITVILATIAGGCIAALHKLWNAE